METAKVGMREFRHQFGDFVDAGKPVAITKHGRTVGFYIPVHRKPETADLDALEEAGRVLDALMAQKGISEDAAVEDFKRLRRGKRRRG
jgi:antitoxin (DNA-binding transcriptional repressor) of toxin-antitoxin stability system